MQLHDVVVGAVSAGLGVFLLIGTLVEGHWLMELGRPRMLADAIGRRAARVLLGLLGVVLIGLGAVIALGWRMHWS